MDIELCNPMLEKRFYPSAITLHGPHRLTNCARPHKGFEGWRKSAKRLTDSVNLEMRTSKFFFK